MSMNKEQLKEWTWAIRGVADAAQAHWGNIPAASVASAHKAADFLQSLADIGDAPEKILHHFHDGTAVNKEYADWHIMQHVETKRKLDDAQRRINIAVKLIEINNSYEYTAWNSMFGIAQILTMPQSEFEAFLEQHSEYRP